MNFNDWAPLKLVDSEFLKRVRLCYVFGKTGYEALMITDEDEVYACGSNFGGCLGLEFRGPRSTISLIPGLSKKKVKGFSSCIYNDSIFVCAYTFNGPMYCWGKIFTHSNVTETPTLMTSFSKKVVEVDCGVDHCLTLTAEGEVYSWGYNDYGQLGHGAINVAEEIATDDDDEISVPGSLSSADVFANLIAAADLESLQVRVNYSPVTTMAKSKSTNCDIPTLVGGLLKGKVVHKISCGKNFSIAVLDTGEVYSWGSNSDGQLGVNDQKSPHTSPIRIELNNVVIRKITCGASHVLAASDIGELFSWGKNDFGQLGLGDTISRYLPTKIEDIGKITDIASMSTSNTSAAMNESSKICMWGFCGGFYLKEPQETQLETLHEVFAYFGDSRVMYKPKSRQFQCESICESLKNAFNNNETSDLTIVAEGKKIYVHKAILKMRSNYFKTMFQEPWVEDSDKEIELNQKYDGIYAYLQYVYTGDLKASPETALDLRQIAEEYQDLVLKKIGEKCIKFGITTENVADLYTLAFGLNAKKLAKYCLTFACNHIQELIESKGFREWDKEIIIDFMIECKKRKMFKS